MFLGMPTFPSSPHTFSVPRILSETFHRYRAPANARGRSDAQMEARGFLDGDFLEQYLTLDQDSASAEIDAIREGANLAESIEASDASIRSLLEALQSLH
jgi:DNA damage-binding protein 1